MPESIIKFSREKIFQAAAIAAVLLIIIFVSLTKSNPGENKEKIKQLVILKVENCTEKDVLSCYKKISEELKSQYKTKEILEVFSENEKTPTFFKSCHTLLHFLGQEEYKEVQNTGEALSHGLPICFAGFYHGVLEEYLESSGLIHDPQKLLATVPSLCGSVEEFGTKKIYNECLHGLGHALMYVTEGELPQSLKLCDGLSTEEDRNWCYSGSFMENSTSSTNRDHPSTYLDAKDPLYPCTILEDKYLNMCYTLQSFYFSEISKYDWVETEKLCKRVPLAYQRGCFDAIGQTQVGFTQDLSIMKENCSKISSQENQDQCFSGVVGGLGERYEDGWKKALEFCNVILTEETSKDVCFDRIINVSKIWIPEKNLRTDFCNLINREEKRALCLSIQ